MLAVHAAVVECRADQYSGSPQVSPPSDLVDPRDPAADCDLDIGRDSLDLFEETHRPRPLTGPDAGKLQEQQSANTLIDGLEGEVPGRSTSPAGAIGDACRALEQVHAQDNPVTTDPIDDGHDDFRATHRLKAGHQCR